MEVYWMNYLSYLRPESKNELYLFRYLKFIEHCKTQIIKKDVYTEKHHILPRSLFPKHIKNQRNIVLLTGRQHFIAHWMLAKFIRSPKMWFSFNLMKRCGYNSVLYNYGRKEIALAISKSNSGRKRSPEHLLALKNSIIGKSPARNVYDNTNFWADRNDVRWKTGEIVTQRSGYTHSEETKTKIKNKNKGTKFYQDVDGNVRMLHPEQVSADYVPYINPAWYESTVSDTIWCYNPDTKEQLRIDNSVAIPTGFIKGRINHQGFTYINDCQKSKYIDIVKKTYVFLEEHRVNKKIHVCYDGQSLDKVIVLLHQNNIIVGKKYILKYLEGNNIFLSYKELNTGIIKAPHFNNNLKTHAFRTKYKEANLTSIGINLYKLLDFKFKEEYNLKENTQ